MELEIKLDNTDSTEYTVRFSGKVRLSIHRAEEFKKELAEVIDDYEI